MPSPSFSNSDSSVVIVGGGLSGLAAAVELVSQNIPVTLFDQKPRLGGRAYSFVDATTGDVIDNGQHVLIAGYHRSLSFLDRIGTTHLLSVQENPSLTFHHPERGFCSFKAGMLPSPFHVLTGILSSDLFSFADKLRLLRAGISIGSRKNSSRLMSMTIETWLDSIGQSEETKRSFWEPLAISIMNEHIAKASASIFVRSLHSAFLAGRKNAALVLPRVGLSQLYVDASIKYLEARGAHVSVNTDVEKLTLRDGKVNAVRLRDGSILECDAVILAVPHYEVESLIPPESADQIAPMSTVPSTPIVSIHVWFEEDFMQHPFVGLVDRRVQWAFNKRMIGEEAGRGGHISCVISAGERFVGMSNEDLVRIALEDLRSVYGSAVPARAVHSVVVREKRATFSCTPEAEKIRPGQRTTIPNLFLAGDWTNTGLPATIEGAIISGERCAQFALDMLS